MLHVDPRPGLRRCPFVQFSGLTVAAGAGDRGFNGSAEVRGSALWSESESDRLGIRFGALSEGISILTNNCSS